jgi:hypothetical protein
MWSFGDRISSAYHRHEESSGTSLTRFLRTSSDETEGGHSHGFSVSNQYGAFQQWHDDQMSAVCCEYEARLAAVEDRYRRVAEDAASRSCCVHESVDILTKTMERSIDKSSAELELLRTSYGVDEAEAPHSPEIASLKAKTDTIMYEPIESEEQGLSVSFTSADIVSSLLESIEQLSAANELLIAEKQELELSYRSMLIDADSRLQALTASAASEKAALTSSVQAFAAANEALFALRLETETGTEKQVHEAEAAHRLDMTSGMYSSIDKADTLTSGRVGQEPSLIGVLEEDGRVLDLVEAYISLLAEFQRLSEQLQGESVSEEVETTTAYVCEQDFSESSPYCLDAEIDILYSEDVQSESQAMDDSAYGSVSDLSRNESRDSCGLTDAASYLPRSILFPNEKRDHPRLAHFLSGFSNRKYYYYYHYHHCNYHFSPSLRLTDILYAGL